MADLKVASCLPETSVGFLVNLYEIIRSGKQGENLFFSPVSIQMALAMTLLGARGRTGEQLRAALHLANIDEDALHADFRKYLDTLRAKKDTCTLTMVNKHFVQNGYSLVEKFQEISRKMYDAEAKNLDFSCNTEASRNEINNWVAENTGNMIEELIKPGVLSSLTRLVLVNACYFKGEWKAKFNKMMSKPEPFSITATHKENVVMMKRKGKYMLGHNPTLKFLCLEIPYKGEDLSMFVILPEEIDGLDKVEKSLTVDVLNTMEKEMHPEANVFLWLPQYFVRMNVSLVETLKKMGVTDLFSVKDCDLSGLTDRNDLYVSEAVHEAYVKVDEEGTEAAAATGMVANLRSMPIAPPFEFKADHPFLFYIKDKTNNVILFFGRFVKPSAPVASC